ncbi:MAG: hypothetical protein JST54_25585 [Deltaproteobacteria bacterium]|nr:hypothetical protein [Deltaproteobacteria bacterium]
MKLAKIGSTVVLMSSLLGSAAAHAAPGYGAPAYNGPRYDAPAYSAPEHEAEAVPVNTWYDRDGDRDHERGGWRREEIARFDQQQAQREANENARLASERASFMARYGWDACRVRDFDGRQAEDRARFEQAQAERRQNFFNWLASAERPHHHHGYNDYDYD